MKNLSLHQIQHQLSIGTVTCQEIVQYYLSQINAHLFLNAFVEVYAEEALNAAKKLDEKIKSNPKELGKLFGCVISVKDMIVMKDHEITAGSRILEGFISQLDATCIAALLAEDAIVIGRTNCDEFGMGSANKNSYYGPVKNGANPERISGGSSGGAAVSVQMDMCLIALGTDTGGSVRQPASMCGLWGIKPTYGLISRHGLVAYASSFDQVGIVARHGDDIHMILQIISVSDDFDATMMKTELYEQQEEKLPEKLKIAYLKEALENNALDPEIQSAMYQTFEKWNSLGITVENIDFKLLDVLVPCYYILTTAEASSNLSRYDGIRYGYRSSNAQNLHDMYIHTRTEGLGTEVKKRIMLGSFVLSASYYDAYFTKAQQIRQLICNELDKIFESYDFIIMPTSPKVAWPIHQNSDDPLESYMADIYTVLANLAGIPAISVPLGNNIEKLPFGIQILGRRKSDRKVLKFAREFFIQ